MPRLKRQNLRGSVTQNTTSQRGRARPEESRFHGLKVGLVAGGLCFLIIAAALLWHNRWPHRQARRLAESALATTQKARFAVRDVIVEGRLHTEKDELFAALGTEANAPILAFDPDEAREKISQLPWVAAVTIERRLPDTILVRLTERQPLARWQHNNKTVVIDATGAVLATAKPELFATLPLVVGEDAPSQAQKLLTTLKDFPAIASLMKAATRVGERRWNLYLQPNILVRLPEQDMAAALARLARLDRDQKVLSKNLVAIDLRLPDRLALEPASPSQAEPTKESRP